MSRTRIVYKISGFEDVRRWDTTKAELLRRAVAIRAGCGEGYRASVQQGRSRARANVAAWTFEARHDNQDHNTLLRNLDRGRLA